MLGCASVSPGQVNASGARLTYKLLIVGCHTGAVRRSIALAILICVSGLVVATALGRTPGPVLSAQWKAAISDYYASGLSRADSCAATVVARTHLPPRFKEGTAIVHAFDLHERAVCTGTANPLSATVGMSDSEVADIFGPPIPWRSGPRCWDYHASSADTSIDGVRICFSNGVVSKIQRSLHG